MQPGGVDVGRGCSRCGFVKSKWANPFAVTDGRSVQESIDLFRSHLLAPPALMSSLKILICCRLICHCHLCGPCHADVLSDAYVDHVVSQRSVGGSAGGRAVSDECSSDNNSLSSTVLEGVSSADLDGVAVDPKVERDDDNPQLTLVRVGAKFRRYVDVESESLCSTGRLMPEDRPNQPWSWLADQIACLAAQHVLIGILQRAARATDSGAPFQNHFDDKSMESIRNEVFQEVSSHKTVHWTGLVTGRLGNLSIWISCRARALSVAAWLGLRISHNA